MEKLRNMVLHTGDGGLRLYLTEFFKELGVEEKDLPAKVEEAFKSIIDNPDTPNIFGVKVYTTK